jgi:kynurenine formamidase
MVCEPRDASSTVNVMVSDMQRRQAMAAAAAGLVGTVAGGAALAGPAAAATPPVRLDQLRLVFLSHVNDPATTSGFPGDAEFTLETVFTVPEDGFYLQYVKEGEHTGTHWGAPVHFHEDGLAADQLDPGDLFLPAVKIDIRAKAARNADYAITVADLQAWERDHGRIPDQSAVIFWTGWEDRWGTPRYANLDAQGRIHQPGMSLEAAQWLVDTGRLGRRGSIGSDTFGADVGIDETFAVTSLLFHRHRISLENLNNLGALPATGAWVLVGGPRNHHGSGSPATIFGVIPPGC